MNYSVTVTCFLCTLMLSNARAETVSQQALPPPSGKSYVAVFGGGGAVMSGTQLSQLGTSFHRESEGGAIAINAFGKSNNSSTGVIGAHVGYRWPEQLLRSKWRFSPATELEGYYLGGETIHGADLNNDTTVYAKHHFRVAYPIHAGVFLVDAVININHSDWVKFRPYIGVGIGGAVVSISGATSIQTTPAEPGINHYNSCSSDTISTFAAQPKIGLYFDINQKSSLFLEYRFLYISSTDYQFGSTVYPTHSVTSNWDIKMGPQYYNLGTIGIQYDL